MPAFRSYGTLIITSPNPPEIEHDNIPLEQKPHYRPEADIAISMQLNFWEKALQKNVLIQAVAMISSRENAHIRHMGISHLAV